MLEAAKKPQSTELPTHSGKYFKLQIRGWTDFDPMDKTLPEIAEAIQRGDAFLTAIEVLEVKNDPSDISDNLVREGFQNVLAARRILRSIEALPPGLLQELRSALDSQEQVARKPAVSEVAAPLPAKLAS
jgi:hypothetical protein